MNKCVIILLQSDVAMESHPATPAGSMHKAESTTMLCEDTATANTSSSSEANVSSGEVSSARALTIS